MPVLANLKHEAFCQAMVSGATAGNAQASYAAVYDKNPITASVKSAGSRLHRHGKIMRRILELKVELQAIEARATERAIDRLAVTKENVLAELARIGFANMLDYVQPDVAGASPSTSRR